MLFRVFGQDSDLLQCMRRTKSYDFQAVGSMHVGCTMMSARRQAMSMLPSVQGTRLGLLPQLKCQLLAADHCAIDSLRCWHTPCKQCCGSRKTWNRFRNPCACPPCRKPLAAPETAQTPMLGRWRWPFKPSVECMQDAQR